MKPKQLNQPQDASGIVQGDRARRLYEWFEEVRARAAQRGISLPPLSLSELRTLSTPSKGGHRSTAAKRSPVRTVSE